MKVVEVIDGLGTGGAERSLAELVPRLRGAGIDVVICIRFRRAEGVQAAVRAAGGDVRLLAGRTPLGQARSLRRILRVERPDLVHTTLFTSTLVGRLATTGTGVPVLTSLVSTPYEPIRLAHDPNLRPSSVRIVKAVDRLTARRTTHFHAISAAVRDAAVRHLRIDPARVTVVERGRDPARLGEVTAERRTKARAALGVDEGALVVAAAGRQEFVKGHRFLLEAAARLVPDHPELVVVLAGRDGNASAELRALHERLGLGDRVRFLGHRDDLPDVLAAADVFVLPSILEGLGGVVIEAMGLGLPVVATDVPAVRETVEPGRSALLVPPGDAGALAGALGELLADGDRRAELGRRGRARFEARYTLDRCAERTVELYRAVAGT